MRKPEWIVLFTVTMLPLTAFAGVFDCRDLDSLDNEVTSCEQNAKYASAASLCLEKFRAFKAGVGETVEQGERTSRRIEGYLNHILYPEDWDAPPAVIGDPKAFFESHKCYSANRDRIESLLSDLRVEVNALKIQLKR